jgi:exopolysaccharide biosynthesis protein
VTIAPRPELPGAPRGDLLQAGPLLVRAGAPVVEDGVDAEGFSAGSSQFDSDITSGRYPRAALGISHGTLLAVACDGRADDEAGLTMRELAEALAALGSQTAINLDGGGSTSLVCGGVLRNVPREEHGVVLPGGRAVSTALEFRRR